jgi:4-hydroxy-tetrahydrodipicolinate synthase
LDFGNVITAMVTPFDEELAVNWSQVEPLINYLIDDQHTDGLVICGTTGESPTLSEEEKLKLIEASVRYARGRCKIIAGTGGNDTAHTIYFSQKVEKLGVDALLVVAPYYNRPSQEGLYQHFKAVAEAVKLPVILYNVPGRTGVNINADTTIRLSQISNIVATKDCASTDQLTRIISGADEGFHVYSGEDANTLPALAVGCRGIISVASHVIGKQMQTMIKYYLAGNTQQAAEMHRKLHPVFTGIFHVPSPAPIKFALKLHGMNTGGVRLPLIDVNEQEGQFIRSLF